MRLARANLIHFPPNLAFTWAINSLLCVSLFRNFVLGASPDGTWKSISMHTLFVRISSRIDQVGAYTVVGIFGISNFDLA